VGDHDDVARVPLARQPLHEPRHPPPYVRERLATGRTRRGVDDLHANDAGRLGLERLQWESLIGAEAPFA
jgi:hypothetical protein